MKLAEADDKAFQVFEIPKVVVVADALAVFSCPFHDESNVRNAYEAQPFVRIAYPSNFLAD
jgi:hypothetical protein